MDNIFRISRTNAGMSQTKVAEKLVAILSHRFEKIQSAVDYIIKLEHDRYKRPNIEILKTLSSLYDVELERLFSYFKFNCELTEERFKSGLYQKDIATKLDTASSLVSSIETRKRNMKKEEIDLVRKAGVHVSDNMMHQKSPLNCHFANLREAAGLTIHHVHKELNKVGLSYINKELNNNVRIDRNFAEALAKVFNVDICEIYRYIRVVSSNLKLARIFRGYPISKEFLEMLKNKYNVRIYGSVYSRYESGEKRIPNDIKKILMKELNTNDNFVMADFHLD